jgi:6-phosphogluconate dehydrogenase
MPGGNRDAYQHVKPIFEAVAAKYNGEPCVAYLGPKSAGNYVKMVHNGIEYGLMQLTSEIYDLLKKAGGLSNMEMHRIFAKWNSDRLQSFLVEITAAILAKPDEFNEGQHLIDFILDKAKQKGTGKWTSQNAMDLGIPVPTIDSAVTMREISALKAERVQADVLYDRPQPAEIEQETLIEKAEQALYFSFIMAYAQGMHQLADASKTYGYDLNLAEVAKIWRAGCIIRAHLLEDIRRAYQSQADLPNLLVDPHFARVMADSQQDLREVVAKAALHGVPMPAFMSALSYYDAYRSARLPANLLQAQRDYFGAHTYQRTDRAGKFQTQWGE